MSNMILRAVTLTGIAGIAISASAATRVPYTNDFITRISGLVPSDRWMEVPYSVGPLCRSHGSVTATSPYVADLQDGWAMKAGYASADVAFSVFSDNGDQALIVNPTNGSWCSGVVALQPFANEFKTGLLKITADIRTPASAESIRSDSNAFAMIAPVFKSSIGVTTPELSIPLRVGPGCFYDNRSGKEGWFIRAIARGLSSNYGQYDTQNNLTQGNWYRYSVEINLDEGTYKGTFADLGNAHPTAETAPTKTFNFRTYEPGPGGSEPTTLTCATKVSEESGGVVGLAFYVSTLKPSDDAKAPMFDNVSVAWKATGADEYMAVYTNDFTIRRVRTVEPKGGARGTYEAAHHAVRTTSAAYSYGSWTDDWGVNDTTACPALVPTDSPYLGIDGWKRIAGTTKFTLLDPNKNAAGYGWQSGVILRATGKSTRGFVATPLGTTITSGKVRFYFDILPGRKSVLGSLTEAYVICYLAGNKAAEAAYSTSTSASTILNKKGVCGGGYQAAGSANTEINPGHIVYGTGSYKADYKNASNSTVDADMCKWHRYEITADLDARTFTMKVRRAAGSRVYDYDQATEFTDKAEGSKGFMTDAPASVDSIIIATQGQGNYNEHGDFGGVGDFGKFPLFDNLKVCRVNDDGTDGELIYSCDFKSSVRVKSYDGTALAEAIDRSGADGWIMRGRNEGWIYASDDDDPVAVLDGIDEPCCAVQSFGMTSKGCAELKFAADLRPPASWTRKDGVFGVEIGGDTYYQGNLGKGGSWRDAPRISFGFSDTANGTDVVGNRFSSCMLTVGTTSGKTTSAAVVDPTHWYRFRVVARPVEGTFSVVVYDQGATKPLLTDGDGAVVATFADVSMPFGKQELMTAIGLYGCGLEASLGGGASDPDVALVDNLTVNSTPFGVMVIVR